MTHTPITIPILALWMPCTPGCAECEAQRPKENNRDQITQDRP